MTKPHTPDRVHPQAGRILAIAELLRAGHSPATVSEAVRLADAGDAEAAIKLLTTGAARS